MAGPRAKGQKKAMRKLDSRGQTGGYVDAETLSLNRGR